MFVIANGLEAIGLVLGSLLAAGLLCWLASKLADRLHHHSWGAIIVLILLSTLSISGLTDSGFVRLSVAYGLFGALFLWIMARNEKLGSGSFDRGGR